MEIRGGRLVNFLKEIDGELSRKIRLNAVGGTAMTLLGLKTSTLDIDFDMSVEDRREFERVLAVTPHGYRIDIYVNGLIFSQQLPEDYTRRLIPIDAGLRNIRLYALDPVDIVATKTGRLNERDIQDIEACIRKYGLKRKAIEERAKEVVYIGNEENYQKNLQVVIKKFFG